MPQKGDRTYALPSIGTLSAYWLQFNKLIIKIVNPKQIDGFYLVKKLALLTLITCFFSTAYSQNANEHVVELFNAYGEKTVYRHHQDGLLYAIENYQKNGALKSRESFYWEKNGPLPLRLQASSTEDGKGNIQGYSTFDYDPTGYLECEIRSDYKKGEMCANTLYHYSAEGCLKGSQSNNPEPATSSFASSLWDKLSGVASWCTESLTSISNSMSPIKEELSYSHYLKPQTEPLLEYVFGKGFLQFAGYYRQEHSSGTFQGSNTQANPKVRLTLINGILSLNCDLQESLADFSRSHDNHDIHYVFRATEGWTKDILNGSLIKFGYTSEQARMLAKLWIDLIEEVGGVDGGGTILHYAHSIGALDTYNAQFLLSPEQRRMIHVVTIGSPTMIPNEGFGSVVNYASKRDGVCLLDPLRFVGGLLHDDHNIIYLDTFWGAPLVDHPLSVESYQTLIKELAEKFIGTHGTPSFL